MREIEIDGDITDFRSKIDPKRHEAYGKIIVQMVEQEALSLKELEQVLEADVKDIVKDLEAMGIIELKGKSKYRAVK